MATIIVEDGSGVAGANSYISEADLTTYADDRGLTLTGDASVLIIRSMDYLEVQRYIGEKADSAQALQWPRRDTGTFADDEIPAQLKMAQMALCMAFDAGYDPLAPIGRDVKSEKIDTISVTYMDGARSTPSLPSVTRWLSGLLASGTSDGGFGVVRVVRA